MNTLAGKTKIGWREWVRLPGLGIPRIKAKVDTGAHTSSLDAQVIEYFEEKGESLVRFEAIYGSQKNRKSKICTARVVEHRNVTNSGGQIEERIVICTTVQIGQVSKEIEISLACRKNMKFRMLLGRTTISHDFIIDPVESYLAANP